MQATSQYRWVMLGLTSFWLLTFAVTLQSIPPVLGILVSSLGVSHAQAGALMSLFVLPGIFLALPGGVLADRYGVRLVGTASVVVMLLGTLVVALSHGYSFLALGRLIAGTGAALVQMIAARLTTTWFRDREIGLAMGIFNTAMPLGTILSLNFMGVVALRFGWQAPIWIDFGVGLLALALFLALYRTRSNNERASAGSPRPSLGLRRMGWGIWLVALAWALFNAALLSFFTYAPDYFVGQGRSEATAGLLASAPMWGAALLAPAAGLLIDRVGRKWLFVLVGCLGTAVLLFFFPGASAGAAALAVAMGLFSAMTPPGVFSLPAELLPEEVSGFGFGLMVAAAGVGGSVGPYLAGSLRDVTGAYFWSFRAMALFAALGVVPMLLLSRRHYRKKGHPGPT